VSRSRAGGGVTPGPAATQTGGANGAAARGLARSVATPGTDRALARRTQTLAGATTNAARLAALSGGALVAAPNGHASVVFSSAGQGPTGSFARATPTESAHGLLPAPAPAAAAIDVDDLYDQIAARLRRELLLDRERAGELP
jgi:hypothetical protein